MTYCLSEEHMSSVAQANGLAITSASNSSVSSTSITAGTNLGSHDDNPRHRADWGPLERMSHWMAQPLAQLRAQVKAPEGLSHRRLMAWVASVAEHTRPIEVRLG
jgi:hypothetical protein